MQLEMKPGTKEFFFVRNKAVPMRASVVNLYMLPLHIFKNYSIVSTVFLQQRF